MTGVNFFKGGENYRGDYTQWSGDGTQTAIMQFGSVCKAITATEAANGTTIGVIGTSSSTYQYIVQNLIIYNNGSDADSYKLELETRLGSTSYHPICQAQAIAPGHSFQFFSKDAPLIVGDFLNSSSSWTNLRVRCMGGLSNPATVFAAYIRHNE